MNKAIIASVLFVGATGLIQRAEAGKTLTPVLMGAYIMLLLLSIGDMFGGQLSKLMSALAIVTALGVFFSDWLPILTQLGKTIQTPVKLPSGVNL